MVGAGASLGLRVEEPVALSATHRRAYRPVGDGGGPIDIGCAVTWEDAFALIFEVFQLNHDLTQLPLSLVFLDGGFTDGELPLSVHKVRGAWSPSKVAADALPVLFEIALDMLKPIKRGHFARLLRWLGHGSLSSSYGLLRWLCLLLP